LCGSLKQRTEKLGSHLKQFYASSNRFIYRLPELDRIFWPSSSSENEQTNSELECDMLAPSPDILTFTVGSSSSVLLNCNENLIKLKAHNCLLLQIMYKCYTLLLIIRK